MLGYLEPCWRHVGPMLGYLVGCMGLHGGLLGGKKPSTKGFCVEGFFFQPC